MLNILRKLVPARYINGAAFVMSPRAVGAIPEAIISTLNLWPQRSPLMPEDQLVRTDTAAARVVFLCYLARVIKRYNIDCIVDVGANLGQFADAARGAGFKGSIYSFEPQSLAFDVLTKRAESDPNWLLEKIGISSTSGTLSLNLFKDSSLGSFSRLNAHGCEFLGENGEVTGTEVVEIRTLDDLIDRFEQYGSILLKTDTQGHDLDVLVGAEELLRTARVVLCEGSLQPIYEQQCSLAEIRAFLCGRGFVEGRLFPVADDHNLIPIEVDQFFLTVQEQDSKQRVTC